MSLRPSSRSVGVLGWLTLAALSSTLALGCDTGAAYEDDTAIDPGTDTGNAGGSSTLSGPTPSTLLPTLFGSPEQTGEGSSSDRWYKTDVHRNDLSYLFMANGWGPNFGSQTVSYHGTSFSVDSMQGSQGSGFEPASYPTMFCGSYSDSQSGACGLPKAISEIGSLRTGWRWNPSGNSGEYNAAYDIWLSNSADISSHSAFLMIWLRDPKGQQPAGSRRVNSIKVANAPGTWHIWSGNVGGKPCISYARADGQDSPELEVDVMDFVRDVPTRQLELPGSHILSVAVGFEIWNGPVTGLQSQDFYVQVE